MTRHKVHLTWWWGVALLAVAVALLWLAAPGLPDGRLHVYFLDVGQGDAIFVRTPRGQQILVDGGPSPAALLAQLAEVTPFWDRSMDLVVATHPDAAQLTGLLPVLERYHVAEVMDAVPVAKTDALWAAWQEHVANSGATHVIGQRGLQLAVGDLLVTVLHPGQVPLTGTSADDNNNGLVLRLDYGQNSFLLTADAQAEAEAQMLASGVRLKADVLKVGHHGSRLSSSAPFVAAVAPRIAVIQVGKGNHFGQPDPEALARLASAAIFRTDLNGRVEVIGDGQNLWVKTER
jgi:competence protein ComEC